MLVWADTLKYSIEIRIDLLGAVRFETASYIEFEVLTAAIMKSSVF
jgi:hypothetical protein